MNAFRIKLQHLGASLLEALRILLVFSEVLRNCHIERFPNTLGSCDLGSGFVLSAIKALLQHALHFCVAL